MDVIDTASRHVRGRAMAYMLGLLLLLVPLASCGGGTLQAPAAVQFTPIDLGIPAEALNSPITGPVPDTMPLHVSVTFKVNQAVLNRLNGQKVQPGQPSHLEQDANQLGISDSTYQKFKNFFGIKGISLKLSKMRTNLTIDAKASTFGKVLQTSFAYHQYHGRKFFAPKTPPKLPKFLADSIVAITGLDDFSTPPQRTPVKQSYILPGSAKHPAQDCNADRQTLFPKQVAHAYHYDELWNHGWHGENMTVNLVEIDGFYSSDIQNYFSCVNYHGHATVSSVDGAPTQALGEATLDIEMVAGLARTANIAVYQTDGNTSGDIWTQVNDELQQIINDNTNNANAGSAVSISLGAAESEISGADRSAIDQSLSILTKAEHMTVFVASGDCAAFTDRVYRSLSVSFPASDPWSVSVGGTVLSVDGNGNRTNEVVWSDNSTPFSCKNNWGSGGGNSQLFQRPGWQSGYNVNNRYSRGARQIPDVSAAAFALAVYFQGQWASVGGTSAAAPIWAAGQILVNQGLISQVHKFAYSPQEFYVVANNSPGMRPYYDITRGNNLYFPAATGWDFATGFGTPSLWDFYQSLSRQLR
ncbi:MAG: S53 family peptidase [Ktedonobacteraceae bacterium]|nr:S53 family peptidase [Chloroflexota bacterium]